MLVLTYYHDFAIVLFEEGKLLSFIGFPPSLGRIVRVPAATQFMQNSLR